MDLPSGSKKTGETSRQVKNADVNQLRTVSDLTLLAVLKQLPKKMTAAEKRSSTSRKTGPAKIKHKVTASGKRRTKK